MVNKKRVRNGEILIPISSITDFIEEIHNFQKVNGNRSDKIEFFYRGESQYYEKTKPSILREFDYFEQEREITIEAFSRGFSTLSTEGTNFDKISKFQHHTGLTRMLDITTNALTALFFACSANMDKDGYILIFRGSQEDNVLHDQTLKPLKESIKNLGLYDDPVMNKRLIDAIENKEQEANIKFFLSDTAESLSTLSLLSLQSKMDLTLYSISDFVTRKQKPRLLKDHDSRSSYQKFYGEIRRRTPAFEKRIEVLDLFRPVIVIPSQNDERILRQDGAFIVTGLSYNSSYNERITNYSKPQLRTEEEIEKEKKNGTFKPNPSLVTLPKSNKKFFYDNHEDFVVESLKEMRVKENELPLRLEIEADDKKTIIKQLEKLGVNTGKIYVNLDNISNHLRDKYKN